MKICLWTLLRKDVKHLMSPWNKKYDPSLWPPVSISASLCDCLVVLSLLSFYPSALLSLLFIPQSLAPSHHSSVLYSISPWFQWLLSGREGLNQGWANPSLAPSFHDFFFIKLLHSLLSCVSYCLPSVCADNTESVKWINKCNTKNKWVNEYK